MSWAEQEFNYQKVSACFGGSKASKICENFTMWILLYGVIDMMIQIKFWTPHPPSVSKLFLQDMYN